MTSATVLASVNARAPLVGLAVVLFVAPSCDTSQERAEKLAQTAQLQMEAGDFKSASMSISEAIGERDDIPAYYVLQGQINLAMKNPIQAYQSYKSALALDQTNQEALGLVANVAFRVGQLDEAIETAEQLLALNPQSVPALQVKTLVSLQKRQLDDAIVQADKILAINPQDEGGLLMRAHALALQGKTPEAIDVINRITATTGPTASTLSALTNIYRKMQDAPRMREVLRQQIEKSPRDFNIKIDYANLLYKMKAAPEARMVLAGILAGNVPDRAVYDQVTRLWTEFDSAPLPPPLVENVARNANSMALETVLHHFLLSGQLRPGDLIIGRLDANRRATLAPLIGRYQLAAGDVAGARAIAVRALERDPGNVDGLLLSASVDMADRPAQAVIHAQTALSNDPLNPDVYIVLARAHQAKGETWRARQVMEEGLKRIPQSQYLYDSYLPFLHRIGDGNRALALARSLTRVSPASTRAWDRLIAECRSNDPSCVAEAQAGRAAAEKTYGLDDAPGAMPDRGLFGRL